MAKKKYEVDVEKMKKTLWYKVSKLITDISIPVLYVLAIGFALLRGFADKQNAAIYAEMNMLGADMFMKKLVEVSLLSTFCLYGINTFAKSARLNSINKAYLEYFELALRSKITDIQRLKPERILGCAANIATMKADIKSVVIDMVRAVIPFAVIIYSIAKMSLFWAIVMVIVMTGAIAMDLMADKIFHFDSQKSELKSEMSAVSTAQYTAITMLKYMNAERWSLERLQHAQKEAIPAMQGCNKQLYGIIMHALTIAPEIICMYNAMRSGDATLATYLAFNLNSVYWMINLLTGLAETKSELDGELNTMNDLHGDDIPYEKKPAFPERLQLRNIRFYYESDEDKRKPFIFEELILQKGRRYRFVGPSGSGKAEPYSNLIPTATSEGYTKMGDLKVGDYVYSRNGTPTKVTDIFEQGERDVYKVSFNDGRSVLVSDEHLFGVWISSHGKYVYKIKKLSEMMDDYKKELPNHPGRYSYRYVLPRTKAVMRKHVNVPIDPWVLGCFIGNGCCRERYLTISSGTPEVPMRIADKLKCYVKKNSEHNYNYVFYYEPGKPIPTAEFFKDIPEMINCYSKDKRIPRNYIINDIRTRIEIIKGLMDTDGSIGNDYRYHVTYSTTSKGLVEDISEIIYSFGYSVGVTIDKRTEKYNSGYCAGIIFRIPHKFKYWLFSVSSKKERAYQALYQKATKRTDSLYEYNHGPIITNIEFSHREQCRCIKVENVEHLYMTGTNYIVTHNSTAFRFFAGEMVSDYNCDFRVFYIHQEAKLLNFATLRENITLGNPWVPDGDIEALLDDLRMGQWLRNLPKGLDSVVGKDINPSGGESSRISLMRAFIHVRNYTSDVMHRERNTSDLILMDEVTSALDKRTEDLGPDELCTEEAVIKVIDREFRGCTVLIISHEDESSSAFGMRHIVDYKVKLRVVQEGDLEKHIFGEPIPMNQKNYDITPLTQFKVSVK